MILSQRLTLFVLALGFTILVAHSGPTGQTDPGRECDINGENG